MKLFTVICKQIIAIIRRQCLLSPFILLLLGALPGCGPGNLKQFTDVSGGSGIEFANILTESETQNIFNYEYMYNGAGVAIGDVNNDGLPDIFFTANQLPCKLYLNKGNLQFTDITDAAGVAGKEVWKTGTSMADVNGDGLLDIYVCYSGNGNAALRGNQLFINKGLKNGLPWFEEQAQQYGVDAPGANSTQAVFFDYDSDGDLDMFLLDHATTYYSPFFNTYKLRHLRHPYFSNYLFRNDNGHFTDVSVQAGIPGGGNVFGLGVVASDINNDGWPDLYMTNDYEEQDFLLLNNHDGTFTESAKKSLKHISKNGMGCDVADYNNDGLMDIFVPDMLPEDNKRQKLLRGPDEYDKYNLLVDSGYFHQNMRNTLQLNRGMDTAGIPQFSEIGQLAGVSNTDWSWSPLFADFDNDGNKDLFITNGYWRDDTNMDFQAFDVASYRQQYGQNAPWYNLVAQMPQTRISNYAFRNDGALCFENVTQKWGLSTLNVSQGAAYADLDNDGDLDLVINNTGEKASVYRNNNPSHAHFLTIQLKGKKGNTLAIGSRIAVETNSGTHQYLEQQPERGYLSCMDPVLHIGLGTDSLITSLTIRWPTGGYTQLKNIKANTVITVDESKATIEPVLQQAIAANSLFMDGTAVSGIGFIQKENNYVDYKREFLLPWELSKQGPKMAKADVNNDGLEDVFIGAPAGQAACLYLQTADGRFKKAASQPWSPDSLYEDVQPVFFDIDGDGDNDLYVVSGGNENDNESLMQDRIYTNDGKGHFKKEENALPLMTASKSCATVADFDGDGRPDIFVGGRVMPGRYGVTPQSYLLKNETSGGKIKFVDVVATEAPSLQYAGMITGAVWTHITRGRLPDLVVAGEWMPVKIFVNEKGKLEDKTTGFGLDGSGGLWTCVIPGDLDNDGDEDFLLGNLAPNTPFKASANQPMTLCFNDFYATGTNVPVLCYYIQDTSYPYPSRDELAEAIPQVKKKFIRYNDYATARFDDIFSAGQQKGMQKRQVNHLKNAWLENNGHGKLVLHDLPVAAQFSAIQAAVIKDFDGDGKNEVFCAGNFYPFRVQLGREDAGKGLLLTWDKQHGFLAKGHESTGVWADGDVRDMLLVKSGKKDFSIIISKNSAGVQVLKPVNRY